MSRFTLMLRACAAVALFSSSGAAFGNFVASSADPASAPLTGKLNTALPNGSTGRTVSGTVYWDNITNLTTIGGVSNASAPVNGVGNLQTGMAVALDNFTPGVSPVQQMDLPIVNTSGSSIVSRPMRLNVWIWQTINAATTATDPQFSDLLDLGNGPGNPTSIFLFPSVSINNNTFATATVDFGAPFTISPTTASNIGIAFNWQVDNGSGYTNLSGLNTGVTGGGTTPAPLVGTNLLGGPNFGYFRSANSTIDINGQFAAGSARNVGINSAVPFGLYIIPEPGSLCIVLGAIAVMLRRR